MTALCTIVLDFETFYGKGYSLSTSDALSYVRDKRFKAHGAAFKIENRPARWITGCNLPAAFAQIDWSTVAVVGHNMNEFDAIILSEVYGVTPALFVDTLSMARYVLGGSVKSRSLHSLGEHFGLGGKLDGGKALNDVFGVRDLSPEQERDVALYAKRDADLTRQLYDLFLPDVPDGQFQTMDWCARMVTEPTLRLNSDKLSAAHAGEIRRTREIIQSCDIEASDVISDKKFAELLQAAGQSPPTKVGKTGKVGFAFAKTDREFVELQNHGDERVSALARARLNLKSNIEVTRASGLLDLSKHDGRYPVALRASGAAQTNRLSGWLHNPQNFSRDSAIRGAIEVADGFRILVADSSQIELRIVMCLAGELATVKILRDGGCPYSGFAAEIYGVPVSKALAKADPAVARMRQVGKIATLSCMYGVGWRTFQKMLWVQAGISVDDIEAERIVKAFCRRYSGVTGLWRTLDAKLAEMRVGTVPEPFAIPELVFSTDSILLPDGFKLKYPELEKFYDKTFERSVTRYRNYDGGTNAMAGGYKSIWGGSVCENASQALAASVITDQIHQIRQRYVVALQVHDEAVCVVPEAEVDEAKEFVRQTMSTPPAWWPDLSVSCEIGVAATYGEAK